MRKQAAAALLLAALAGNTAGGAADDYWVWHPKVRLDRVLDRAGSLYLFQGELTFRQGKVRYDRRGFSPPNASAHPLILVYRCETLEWPGFLPQRIERDLEAFAAMGNRVWGIQLDFDAATRHLERYGGFLRRVREQLPPRYRLSVTGLMDWGSQGRLEDLNRLHGVVDEIVFQAYQGRKPVRDHGKYLRLLAGRALTVPFKLGLVEGGDYDGDALHLVQRHPAYRGKVIFLVPPLRDSRDGGPPPASALPPRSALND